MQVNAQRAETTNKRRVRMKQQSKQGKYDARSLSVTTENNNHALSSNPHLSNAEKLVTSVSLSKQTGNCSSNAMSNPAPSRIKIRTILAQEKLEKLIGPVKYDKEGDPVLSEYEITML